eukprot:1350785-Amorphochlora_amoeboformis.AAC.1
MFLGIQEPTNYYKREFRSVCSSHTSSRMMRVQRPLQRRYRRGYAANLIVLAVTIPSAAFFSTAYRRVLASPGSLRAFQQSSLGSLTTVQRNPQISLREGKRSVSSERSNLACGADVSAKEAGSGAKAAGGGPWGR